MPPAAAAAQPPTQSATCYDGESTTVVCARAELSCSEFVRSLCSLSEAFDVLASSSLSRLGNARLSDVIVTLKLD